MKLSLTKFNQFSVFPSVSLQTPSFSVFFRKKQNHLFFTLLLGTCISIFSFTGITVHAEHSQVTPGFPEVKIVEKPNPREEWDKQLRFCVTFQGDERTCYTLVNIKPQIKKTSHLSQFEKNNEAYELKLIADRKILLPQTQETSPSSQDLTRAYSDFFFRSFFEPNELQEVSQFLKALDLKNLFIRYTSLGPATELEENYDAEFIQLSNALAASVEGSSNENNENKSQFIKREFVTHIKLESSLLNTTLFIRGLAYFERKPPIRKYRLQNIEILSTSPNIMFQSDFFTINEPLPITKENLSILVREIVPRAVALQIQNRVASKDPLKNKNPFQAGAALGIEPALDFQENQHSDKEPFLLNH